MTFNGGTFVQLKGKEDEFPLLYAMIGEGAFVTVAVIAFIIGTLKKKVDDHSLATQNTAETKRLIPK